MVIFQNLSKNGEILKNVGENIKNFFYALIFFYTLDIKNIIFTPKFYQHFLPSLLMKLISRAEFRKQAAVRWIQYTPQKLICPLCSSQRASRSLQYVSHYMYSTARVRPYEFINLHIDNLVCENCTCRVLLKM